MGYDRETSPAVPPSSVSGWVSTWLSKPFSGCSCHACVTPTPDLHAIAGFKAVLNSKTELFSDYDTRTSKARGALQGTFSGAWGVRTA
jgi:hypothetical protein